MESKPEDIIPLYDQYAQAWDEDRPRNLVEKAWLDRFLDLVPSGGSVLDIGCGAGDPIATYFLESGYQVTGLDSSAAMLAICRNRFPEANWVHSDMRHMNLGQRFDGLIAWDSFFHLPKDDQRDMFQRFAEHAATGAVLLFTSGPEEGEVTGNLRHEPLYHASLSNTEYQALLAQINFEVVRQINNDPHCAGHTVWLAQMNS